MESVCFGLKFSGIQTVYVHKNVESDMIHEHTKDLIKYM